eukprot:29379-Prymnesium_polylepis.1
MPTSWPDARKTGPPACPGGTGGWICTQSSRNGPPSRIRLTTPRDVESSSPPAGKPAVNTSDMVCGRPPGSGSAGSPATSRSGQRASRRVGQPSAQATSTSRGAAGGGAGPCV